MEIKIKKDRKEKGRQTRRKREMRKNGREIWRKQGKGEE